MKQLLSSNFKIVLPLAMILIAGPRAYGEIESLNKLANALFMTQQDLHKVEEDFQRISISRLNRQVKKDRLDQLQTKKQLLEARWVKAKEMFSKLTHSHVFISHTLPHINGKFMLSGDNGAVACVSLDEGYSGTCTIDSENITFRW